MAQLQDERVGEIAGEIVWMLQRRYAGQMGDIEADWPRISETIRALGFGFISGFAPKSDGEGAEIE